MTSQPSLFDSRGASFRIPDAERHAPTAPDDRRIGEGSAVATDPGGRYVVTQVIGDDGVHLFHVPLDGAAPHETPVRSDMSVAINTLAPNAVAPDGRILVEVISRASWFWPAAILDPRTGKLGVVPPGLAYDMAAAGWDREGRVVTVAMGLECSLWGFRQVVGLAY